MSRYVFTREDRSKGGKNGSRQAKSEAGKLGFEATCISHPFFARHWLQYCPGMKKSPQYKQAVARQLIRRTGETGVRKPL